MKKIDFKALNKSDIIVDATGQINLEEFREFKRNKLNSSKASDKTQPKGLSKRKNAVIA